MFPATPVLPKQDKILRPTEFVYAKDQPEYTPLPVIRTEDGEVISRWKLTFKERLRILLNGNIWLSLLTFNKPLQPIKLYTSEPNDFGILQ